MTVSAPTQEHEVVSLDIEVRCSHAPSESHTAVVRQIAWYRRRIAEMMPAWRTQYREYCEVGFGVKEP